MSTKLKPIFWKLSQGISAGFTFKNMIESIDEKLVYVHRKTPAMVNASTTQAEDFVNANIGDYFYLTHGNQGVYLLGQFTGPVNFFTKYEDEDWMSRPFRLIKSALDIKVYNQQKKWWTPDANSTFIKVPEAEYRLFEKLILQPYFGISLKRFG